MTTEEKTMPSQEKPLTRHMPDCGTRGLSGHECAPDCPLLLAGEPNLPDPMAEMPDPNHTHIRRQVEAFHRKFAHPVLPVPMVPADRVIRKRLAFIVEEVFEAIEACTRDGGNLNEIARLKTLMFALIRNLEVDVDLPELVDALGDIDYVVEGARLECGVNGMEIANEIQRANMSKSTEKTPEGKTVKPDGWTPPDIEGVLVKMGWVK